MMEEQLGQEIVLPEVFPGVCPRCLRARVASAEVGSAMVKVSCRLLGGSREMLMEVRRGREVRGRVVYDGNNVIRQDVTVECPGLRLMDAGKADRDGGAVA